MKTTTATAPEYTPISIKDLAKSYGEDDTRKYWGKAGYYSDAQLWSGGIQIIGYVFHGFRGPHFTILRFPAYRQPIRPFVKAFDDGNMTLTWRRIQPLASHYRREASL